MEAILNYRTHIVSDLSEVGQASWDALVQAQAAPTPFLSYAFLHALHASGSASPETGSPQMRSRDSWCIERHSLTPVSMTDCDLDMGCAEDAGSLRSV